jgi:hypothetical protein
MRIDDSGLQEVAMSIFRDLSAGCVGVRQGVMLRIFPFGPILCAEIDLWRPGILLSRSL